VQSPPRPFQQMRRWSTDAEADSVTSSWCGGGPGGRAGCWPELSPTAAAARFLWMSCLMPWQAPRHPGCRAAFAELYAKIMHRQALWSRPATLTLGWIFTCAWTVANLRTMWDMMCRGLVLHLPSCTVVANLCEGPPLSYGAPAAATIFPACPAAVKAHAGRLRKWTRKVTASASTPAKPPRRCWS
jgi:hypothetical protein